MRDVSYSMQSQVQPLTPNPKKMKWALGFCRFVGTGSLDNNPYNPLYKHSFHFNFLFHLILHYRRIMGITSSYNSPIPP